MTTGWRHTFSASRGPQGVEFSSPAFVDRVVSSLALGEVFVVTFEEYQEKRSGRANRFLWGPVYNEVMEVILSKEGYRRDEWPQMKLLMHEGLCAKYQGYVTCPVTKMQVRKFRSSKANQREFSDYITWLAQMVAEDYGVAITLPGEDV